MKDSKRYRGAAAVTGLWLLLALIVLLAACDSETPRRRSSEKFFLGPLPTLIVEGAPPCAFPDWSPLYNLKALCGEMVYDNVTPPEAAPALMGLAFAPDGTLFFARTAFGEIWAMRDTDGNQFFEEPYRVAGGLTLPSGIAVHEGAIYVVTLDGVLRLDDPNGDGIFDQPTVLVADVLAGRNGWSGSVGIGPDGRLYVSVGAAGEGRTPGEVAGSSGPAGEGFTGTEDAGQGGMLLSYALGGSDQQVVATGFHAPGDFAWHPTTGELWIVDRGRPAAQPPSPDVLNRVESGGDYAASPPAFIFEGRENNLTGIAFYASDAIPYWQGDLLVVQHGSWNQPEPAGYAVIVVKFDETFQPSGATDWVAPRGTYWYSGLAPSTLSLMEFGFFPYHPVDVAVSAEGWIYVAVEEGRILRFRPRPKANEAIPVYLTKQPN